MTLQGFGRNPFKTNAFCILNICVCGVDGNILALVLNMNKRTGKAVLAVAVVVSVAKILRANERSQLLASGSNAY